MHKYTFPAVFTEEENGQYSVEFPDIEGCVTCGDDLGHAIETARDALSLMLCEMEDSGDEIPSPSKVTEINAGEKGFVTLVDCDTVEYRKALDEGEITKTVTIPIWLSILAEKADIDLSAILKKELKRELGI